MRTLIGVLLATILVGCARDRSSVTFEPAGGAMRVLLGGHHFTTLVVDDVQKPYLYPLHGPGGEPITRGFPIEDRPDEAKDHAHHTSFWFAHGDVNGHDFWHGPRGERIVCVGRPTTEGDAIVAVFEWRDGAGVVVCTEWRRMRFGYDDTTRIIDWDVTLKAGKGPITFGDTKEGTFAIRLAPRHRLKGPVARGTYLNANGQRDDDCWGKRAAWVDNTAPVDGAVVGVAIFDHPGNPRHPTWWHVRGYGLLAANAFGVHDFEGQPEGTGDLTLDAGATIRFRYRVIVHAGRWTAVELEAAYQAYAATPSVETVYIADPR